MISRAICRCSSQARALRRAFFWRPLPWPSQMMLRDVDRDFRRLGKEMEGAFGRFPGAAFMRSHELFHKDIPIVDEKGVKKMKLEIDASYFRPEEITVKTTKNALTITAQRKSGNRVDFEFSKEFDLPEGVEAKEVTCRYSEEQILIIEAPYHGPPEKAPPKAQDIPVQHE